MISRRLDTAPPTVFSVLDVSGCRESVCARARVYVFVCVCVCVLRKVVGGLPKGITSLPSSSQERALLLRQGHAVTGHCG